MSVHTAFGIKVTVESELLLCRAEEVGVGVLAVPAPTAMTVVTAVSMEVGVAAESAGC